MGKQKNERAEKIQVGWSVIQHISESGRESRKTVKAGGTPMANKMAIVKGLRRRRRRIEEEEEIITG